jgi:PKD repeat protein
MRSSHRSTRHGTGRTAFALKGALLAPLAVVVLATCRDDATTPVDVQPVVAPAVEVTASVTSEVLVGAGDIASCATANDEATAKLLDGIAGTVFTVGDNAYNYGSDADYTNCYNPTWGRHKDRTKPVVGDRDYNTTNAAGYSNYFGAAAGPALKFYYSYDIGNWHVVVLNSKLSTTATSAQVNWLKSDLAATANKTCTIAIWHKPYFSSTSGVRTALKPVWDVLYANGVELVINADNRYYERFAPQDPSGVADPVNGIREIIAGTGGAGTTSFPTTPRANSEVRIAKTHGVLKLTLHASSYDWEFVPVAGKTLTDAGSASCNGETPPPVARPGGPYSSEATVNFNGSASSDPQGNYPLTYDWDFGDGTPHGTGATPSHTYTADGTYTVTLVVTDATGDVSAPATTTATIANVAPTVNAGPDKSVETGQPVTVSATFSDPGTDDAPWSYTIDWGDATTPETGTTSDQSAAITATHTYATAGTYTAMVTVTDKDGGSGSDVFSVNVSDPTGIYTLIGAGDIAECGTETWHQNDEATGNIIDQYPQATVVTIGDNAYPNGRLQDYNNCYEPAWGRHKGRTWAALGNHEYDAGNADGTWDYFGDRAGPRGKGYYSFDLGNWHVVVLNDNPNFVPIAAGSEQDVWLQNDLAANTKPCTIAIWHQPMVMSSNQAFVYRASRKIFWDRLYAAGAEIILNGHQHFYERFAPMTPDRVRDDATGIRQFIVGTGGESSVAPTIDIAPNSEALGQPFGVLKLTLRPDGYDWEFLATALRPFTDTGSGTCH